MKDWRGTEIEVGSKIFFAGGRDTYKSFGIGVVTAVQERKWSGSVWVDWLSHNGHSNKKSRALDSNNVTVLTKDMLDD